MLGGFSMYLNSLQTESPCSLINVFCDTAAALTTAITGTESLVKTKGASGTTISDLYYYIPLLLTNIVATTLVGYKFWSDILFFGLLIRLTLFNFVAGNIVGKSRFILLQALETKEPQ